MGRRGPPPKPTHLKLLEGTYRRDLAPKREPKAPACKPARMAPPAGIGKGARAEWRRIVPILHKMGILSTADRSVIAAYCQAWQRWLEFEKCIDEHGSTFTTEQGYVCQRPEVSMAVKQGTMLRQLAGELGLSPSARSRVEVPEPKPSKDATEDLLFGKSRGA